MNTERHETLISSFIHNAEHYKHVLFTHERDQVELIHIDTGETILEFGANCIVKNKDGKIGDLSMCGPGGTWVYFEGELRTKVEWPGMRDIYKIEVEVSKRYLDAQLAQAGSAP